MENEIATCCKLYEAEEGRCLIHERFLRAEVFQYRRQLNRGKDHSWEEYLQDVIQNSQLWDELVLAFRDALLRLDLKAVWRSDELEGLVKEIEARKKTES